MFFLPIDLAFMIRPQTSGIIVGVSFDYVDRIITNRFHTRGFLKRNNNQPTALSEIL